MVTKNKTWTVEYERISKSTLYASQSKFGPVENSFQVYRRKN